ncbi:hypothetical protein [Helicobacter sp. 11S03491-1]|uniref:hypothetical protein n=1 Tax=Helicobacter sp. 11S03491-1 TaxID=1476196 RepID=UPI000BD6299B|nr:hypothetical protein [Helicobacter sp. 11S03491-1]PAF42002.1 hypothetical protein BKH45_05325 [Helicobacter sp. 11S03491-1]
MVFEFIFSTQSKSHARIFDKFLQYHATLKNLKFSHCFDLTKTPSEYIFLLDASTQDALDFADDIAKRLPLSIHFRFLEFKISECILDKPQKKSHKQPEFLDALETKEILDKNSSKFCNLFDWVKNIQFLGKQITQPSDLQKAFKQIILKLKNNQSVLIKTSRGIKEISLSQKSLDVMFWDLCNALTYTRLQNLESQVLASYEKPSMLLCPKEVFAPLLLKNKDTFEIRAMLAYDIVLSLLGIFALEAEMGYVFVKNSSSKEFDLSYEHHKLPKMSEIVVSQEGFLIYKKIDKKSKNIFDVIAQHFDDDNSSLPKNIQKNTPSIIHHQKLIIFLSKTHPSGIWVKQGKEYKSLLPIVFENNPKLILQKIENHYDGGEKLLKNFCNHFEDIFRSIQSLPDASMESKNLIDIFSSAAFVLGYQKQFISNNTCILNHAKKFVRDKGPRIDFKLIKENDCLKLDYPKVLRSAMSFLIAGLDEATLSYGFVDSLAEFLGKFALDTSINFGIKNALICGDMLTQKVFLDKMLHYFPKSIHLALPKEGYVDYD